MRGSRAYVLLLVGTLIAGAGVSLVEFGPTVASWHVVYEQGTSPGMELHAGTSYRLVGNAGCKEGAVYPVSIEVVELATGGVVARASTQLRDDDEGCMVHGSFGYLQVPRDGRYVVGWNTSSDLAARGATFDMKALWIPSSVATSLVLGGVVVMLLSVPWAVLAGRNDDKRLESRLRAVHDAKHEPKTPRVVAESSRKRVGGMDAAASEQSRTDEALDGASLRKGL